MQVKWMILIYCLMCLVDGAAVCNDLCLGKAALIQSVCSFQYRGEISLGQKQLIKVESS